MIQSEVVVGSELVRVQRLSPGDTEQAVNDFVWDRLGYGAADENFDALAINCRVLYRDDHDTGKSCYQVVDAAGRGDGTGEWHPVA
jgi:hypothetical protein